MQQKRTINESPRAKVLHDTRTESPVCVWDAKAELGESCLWHDEDRSIYWVDIARALLHRFDPETQERWQWCLPFAATCLVPAGAGRLVAASASGFYELDTNARTVGSRIASGTGPGLRTNDGACDPWGNFWYGTLDLLERNPSGRFYRLTAERSTAEMWGACAITNGPAFDLERRIVFFTDTLARRIYRAPVDEKGFAARAQLFHQFDEREGYPDGMTIDEHGGVWCALWGGRKIVRLSATGEVLSSMGMPVSNPTKCAFGGPRGTTLFITTARKNLSAQQLAEEPLAGGLFAVETDVRGSGIAAFGAR
ncbi:SMP-30/gluconolactonase/LRE family protein [Peristeroidobacter soli]|uniref:SMP-30/gluconolactonase/LRE family protein n=1 Tax=Peristeroidobacter soli TaxID=2497877 RepID=UPI00130057BF|nr:SMP-30/gluconolactonase/LRE family protein [Peristeroidobacter soli]